MNSQLDRKKDYSLELTEDSVVRGNKSLSKGDNVFDRGEQQKKKRDVIVREAARLFRQRGVPQTSLDDVARNVGITKPLIYYYFKNKEQLLAACFLDSFDRADEALQVAKEHPGNGRERLEAYMRRLLLSHLEDETIFVAYHETKTLSAAIRVPIERRRRRRRDDLRKMFVEGMNDGSLRKCDPTVVVGAWAGAVGWIAGSFDPKGALSKEEVVTEVVSLFLRGVEA